MRCFVALDLQAPLGLLRIVGRAPDHFHLTLRFFASLPRDRLELLGEQVSRVARETKPLEIELRGIGAFPSAPNPRVVWVGVGGGRDRLLDLSLRLERGLTSAGFNPPDRPFQPHATLLRIHRPEDRKTAEGWIREGDGASFGTQPAGPLRVYESLLEPPRATHRRVRDCPIGEGG